jgi:hypothetical protein
MNRMRAFVGLLVMALTSAAGIAATPSDVKFSATLTPEQRSQAGLAQLTADNVAVIDGLVRQDEAASKFKDNDVDHTRFSERRTPREREIAGLAHLNATQLAALDQMVKRRINGPETESVGSITTTPVVIAASGVEAITYRRQLEIHGEMSYTYGRSSAGSFQGGELVLTYDDPADRFSVLVAYSEYHGKGLPFFYSEPNGECFRPSTRRWR